nr:DUF2793 domain-containing protein [uncultured Cohaesibacter sp.]
MEATSHLSLPYIVGNQNQKHITHNEALRMLDALVQLSVLSRDLSAPPDEPEDGARYIVADDASGAWSGWESSIAAYIDGTWTELQPKTGWLVWLENESNLLCFDGADWSDFLTESVGVALAAGLFDKIGINATADATNRLALASDASLFNHAGNGHQIKVNKAAAGNTNSLLFQTNWSGRAEMGCAGEDDWSIKVSANGSDWKTGLKVNADTALVQGLQWAGAVSDSGLGAIVERGSNSNGEFVRFADGTQICSIIASLEYGSSTHMYYNWTFPAAYVALPFVYGLVNFDSWYANASPRFSDIGAMVSVSPSVSSITMRQIRITGGLAFEEGDYSDGTRFFAFGRWY